MVLHSHGGQSSHASLHHPSITEACLSAAQTALRVFHLPYPVPMLTTPVQAATVNYPLDPGTTSSVIPQISVCFPLELVLSVWSCLHCTITILSLPTQQFLIEEVTLLLSYQIPLSTMVALLPPSIISPHSSPPLSAPASVSTTQVWSPHTQPLYPALPSRPIFPCTLHLFSPIPLT